VCPYQPTSCYPLPVPFGPPHPGFPLDIFPLEVFCPTYDTNLFADRPPVPVAPPLLANTPSPTHTSDPYAIVPYVTPPPTAPGSFLVPSSLARIPIAFTPAPCYYIQSQPIFNQDFYSYLY
jgi:hypothetical protein